MKITCIILICLSLFILSTSGWAQENDSRFFEDEIQLQATAENWPAVIRLARQAIRQEHDYYHMRYRLALAYYHRGNYALSAHHLRHALAFDMGNAETYRLMHACLQQLGETQAADFLNHTSRIYFHDHLPFKTSITAETGKLAATNEVMSGGLLYANVLIKAPVRNRTWGTLGYTTLSNKRGENNIFQSQYYIQLSYQQNTARKFNAGVHLLRSGIHSPSQKTGFYYLDGVLSLSLSQQYRCFRFEPELIMLHTNNKYKTQMGGALSLDFFGNRRLVLTAYTTFITGHRTPVTDQVITLGLLKNNRLWASLDYLFAHKDFFSLASGCIVYNSNDRVKERKTLRLDYRCADNLVVYLGALHENRMSLTDKKNYAISGAFAGLKLGI